MVNSSSVTRIPGKAAKVGKGVIAAAVVALAGVGTIFGLNLVSERSNVGLVAETRALMVAHSTGSVVGSGSTAAAYLPSPFDANASRLGYRTGSGVAHYYQVDVVANPTGASFDCGPVNARNSGSGNVWFNNVSATGTIARVWSGSTVNSTQGFGCYTRSRVTSTTRLRVRGLYTDSDVTN